MSCRMLYKSEAMTIPALVEELAFKKFRKTEMKRAEVAHDGLQRIRAAYDHSAPERQERETPAVVAMLSYSMV